MQTLLLASSNTGKLLEMTALLADLPVEIITPKQLGIHPEISESGNTYAQNAAIKARTYQQLTGLLTLADDSGLEVEALAGLPGIISAQYSPLPKASDADRRAYLLSQLQDKPRPWMARFRCTVALAMPVGEIKFSEGECTGEIIPLERGTNGFGYDPIFLLPDLGLTMAELSSTMKNELSHRARAVNALMPVLTKLIIGLA